MSLNFFLIYLIGVVAAFIMAVLNETYNKKDIWKNYLLPIYTLISLLSYVILIIIVICWIRDIKKVKEEKKKVELEKKRRDLEPWDFSIKLKEQNLN